MNSFSLNMYVCFLRSSTKFPKIEESEFLGQFREISRTKARDTQTGGHAIDNYEKLPPFNIITPEKTQIKDLIIPKNHFQFIADQNKLF